MKPEAGDLQALCPDLPPRLIAEHLSRLDAAYFERFGARSVAAHLRGLAPLSRLLPVDLLFGEHDGLLTCTVLAFDAPGLFSLVTGTFMGLGFSILSGEVYTYAAPPPRRPVAGRMPAVDPFRRRRVVDEFTGRLEGEARPDTWQADLRARLTEVLGLVEREHLVGLEQARQRVNDWVTQRLEWLGPHRPRSPFETRVEVRPFGDRTLRLTVASDDTPAFLYSLSTALSLHDVNIKRVRIDTREQRVNDELEIELPAGLPDDFADQLQLVALLTKQFTYFLDSAPDPYSALLRFDWLASRVVADHGSRDQWLPILSDARALPYLARLLGASDFLWDDFIRQRYPEVLADLRRRLAGHSRPQRPLAQILFGLPRDQQLREIPAHRERESFLVQLDAILEGPVEAKELSARLTSLAEELLRAAVDAVATDPLPPFAVCGLGKFGSAALGYASDLELLLVHAGGKRDAAALGALLEQVQTLFRGKQQGLFELDLRLRPWGKNAELSASVDTYSSYYGPNGPAHSLERIALTRLRAIAGDAELGARLERLRDELIYEHDWLRLEDLAETRSRQYRQHEAGARNAKYSPGGLVDIEYAVQILQVRHGRQHPALRTPYLEQAIGCLSSERLIGEAEAEALRAAYGYLRRLINALRMLRGVAEDLWLPAPDSREARYLARRMGLHEPDWGLAAAQLEHDFAGHIAFVRDFVRRYIGPAMLPA